MNPLLLRLTHFAVSALAGFAIAWWIQGLRVTGAEQEFVHYKQEQVRILQEHNEYAAKQQQKSAAEYAAARQELADSIAAGDSYRRCVEAGRCSVPRNPSGVREPTTRRACNSLSAPRRVDETGTNPVSVAGESAAPGVVFDCAYTTLQLNHLQQDIESQQGYKE